MKKIICFVLTFFMLASLMLAIPAEDSYAVSDQKVKRMSFYTYPSMKSIKIKWKKRSNVQFYKVYRVDLNGLKDKTPPISKYKKVGKVSGSKTVWIDKNVKKNHYYGYVVRGYKKTKGKKAVLIYDSYMDDDCDYACANLDKPEIINGGNGEFFSNSKDKLYLYVQRDSGVRPDGVVIYRKAKNGSKYKKVTVKKAEKGRFDHGKTYKDATVKPGTTYYYKARTYKKYNGKIIYSSYSRPIVISAVNFTGKYDVEVMTDTGNVGEFVIGITGREYNGDLTIQAVTTDESPVYSIDTGSETYDNQRVNLTGYSTDNSSWLEVPSDGLKIKAGQTCYLKFAFSEGSGYFGGSSGVYSELYIEEGIRYVSSAGLSSSGFLVDLVKGSARVMFDFD